MCDDAYSRANTQTLELEALTGVVDDDVGGGGWATQRHACQQHACQHKRLCDCLSSSFGLCAGERRSLVDVEEKVQALLEKDPPIQVNMSNATEEKPKK